MWEYILKIMLFVHLKFEFPLLGLHNNYFKVKTRPALGESCRNVTCDNWDQSRLYHLFIYINKSDNMIIIGHVIYFRCSFLTVRFECGVCVWRPQRKLGIESFSLIKWNCKTSNVWFPCSIPIWVKVETAVTI